MTPKGRVDQLEQHAAATLGAPGAFTFADWLSWHETGEPAPPAELMSTMTARRAEAEQTMALFVEEPGDSEHEPNR